MPPKKKQPVEKIEIEETTDPLDQNWPWLSFGGVRWVDGLCPIIGASKTSPLYNIVFRKTLLVVRLNHRYYGAFISSDGVHAEQQFIKSFESKVDDLRKHKLLQDNGNLISLKITYSPCGWRKKGGSCAADLVKFKETYFKGTLDVARMSVGKIYGAITADIEDRKNSSFMSYVPGEGDNDKSLFITDETKTALRKLKDSGFLIRSWKIAEAILDSQQTFEPTVFDATTTKDYLTFDQQPTTKHNKEPKPLNRPAVLEYMPGDGNDLFKSTMYSTSGKKPTARIYEDWTPEGLIRDQVMTHTILLKNGFSAPKNWRDSEEEPPIKKIQDKTVTKGNLLKKL